MVQEAEVNAVPVLDAPSEKLVGLLTNSSLVGPPCVCQFLTEERGWQTDECLPGRVCGPPPPPMSPSGNILSLTIEHIEMTGHCGGLLHPDNPLRSLVSYVRKLGKPW